MSGPSRPPNLQGMLPQSFGAANQYQGQQRQPMFMPQSSQQRPAAQSAAPAAPWLGGAIPAFFPTTYQRPQQQTDSKLADLLSAAQRPRPAQPQATQPQSQQQPPPAQPNANSQQAPQVFRAGSPANVPARSTTPNGSNFTVTGYRPGATNTGLFSQAPQAMFQYQSNRLPTASQPRPSSVQAPNLSFLQRPAGQLLPAVSSAGLASQYPTLAASSRPAGFAPAAAPPPLSAEDRKVLPHKSLKRKAVAAVSDPDAEMEPSLEAALVQVADSFISSATSFGCGLARRRKASKLEAADVAVYLEQTWQIRVPGFSDKQVKPYRRPSAKVLHEKRTAAVRQATSAASEASAAKAEKDKAEAEARKAAEGVKLLPD